MRKILTNRLLGFLTVLFCVFYSGSVFGQCPAAPVTCTYTVTANSSTGYTVANGETLCIQSGTYTGNVAISGGGYVYVAAGATFNASSFSSGGRFVNCGIATIPSTNFAGPLAGDSVRFENYGRITFNSIGFNSKSRFINGLSSKMIFSPGVTFSDSYILNNGTISVGTTSSHNFVTNGANVLFVNNDSLITNGNITLNGVIKNNGYMLAKGNQFTFNAGGTITNGCYFLSEGGIDNNGKNLQVTGLIWSRKGLFENKGSMILSGDGFIQGVDFSNDGTFTGSGNFYFSGNTKTQGTFGALGNNLNFYDSSRATRPPLFDQGTPSHASVTGNFIDAKNNTTYIPGTCSPLFQNRFCQIPGNKPNAGSDVTICSPTSTRTLTAQTGSSRWTKSTGANATFEITKKTADASGLTTNGDYFFILTDTSTGARCSDTVRVRRLASPTVTAPTTAPFCSGVAFSTGAITTTGSNVVIDWSRAAVTGITQAAASGTGISPASGFSETLTNTTNANINVTYVLTPRDPACTGVPVNYVVTVKPTPILTDPADQTLCNTFPTNEVAFGSNVVGTTFGWANTNTAIGLGATGTGNNIPSFAATNTGTTNIVGKITVTPTANLCPGSPQDFTITVKPTPILTDPLDQTVCNTKSTAAVTFASSVTGTTFGWANSNTAIGLGLTGAGNIPAFAATNTGNVNITGNITVTPTANLCVGSPQVFAITVRPSPVINSPSTGVVCSGTAQNYAISSIVGATYTWSRALKIGISELAVTGQTANPITEVLTDTVATSVVVRYVIQPVSLVGCSGLPFNYDVTVNPSTVPGTASANPAILCTSGTNSTTLTLAGSTGTIQWQQSADGTSAWADISGATSANYATPILTDTNYYRAVVKSGVCSSVNSNVVTVFVNPLPSTTSAVTLSPTTICAGGSTDISIANTQVGVTYRFYDGTSFLDSVIGTGGLVTKDVSVPTLGSRIITTVADIAGCALVTLNDKPTVQVNPGLVNTYTVTTAPTTICVGASTTVSMNGSQNLVSYQVFDNGNAKSGIVVVGTGSAVTFPAISGLTVGTHTLVVKATDLACGATNLTDNAVVTVNPNPSSLLATFTDTTVCSDAPAGTNIKINITNAIPNVTYEFRLAGVLKGSVTATASTASLIIPVSSLNPVANAITRRALSVQGLSGVCTPFTYADSSIITINPKIDPTRPTFSDPVTCAKNGNVTVNITNAVIGVSYNFKLNGISVRTIVANSNPQAVSIPISSLDTLANTIVYRNLSVEGSILNCGSVFFTDSAKITINPSINPGFTTFDNATICSTDAVVAIGVTNAIIGVTYEFKNGTTVLATTKATSTSFTQTINKNLFLPLIANRVNIFNNLTVEGSVVGGCGTTIFADKPVVTINPNPNGTVPVFSDPIVCATVSPNRARIKITNAVQGVKYVFSLGTEKIDSVTARSASDSVDVSILALDPIPDSIVVRTLSVRGSVAGCLPFDYADKSVVTINPDFNPNYTTFSNDTICSNGIPLSSATIRVTNAIVGLKYVFINNSARIDSIVAQEKSFVRSISITKFTPLVPDQINTFNLEVEGSAVAGGCAPKRFTSKPIVVINPELKKGLPTFTDTTVCPSATTIRINIKNAIKGVKYVFSLGNTKIDSVTAKGITDFVTVKIADLKPVLNQIVIRKLSVIGSIKNCASQLFDDSAKITINPEIDPAFSTFSNDTVCSTTDSATVRITNSIVGVKYVFINGTTRLDSVIAKSTSTTKKLAVSKFNLTAVTNVFELSVEGSVQGVGCTPKTFADKPVVVINRLPSANPSVSATGPICQGNKSKVTINPTELGVTYTISDNGKTLGSLVGTGVSDTLSVVIDDLGKRKIEVVASIYKCGSVTLADTGTVIVNKGSDRDLVVTAPDTICEGNTATVIVEKAQANVIYRVFEGFTPLVASQTGNGVNNLTFIVSGLSVGSHTLRVEATTPGCGAADLKATPVIQVNALPTDVNLVLIGDTVCNTATTATFTIRNTQAGVTYQAIFNNSPIGNAVRSNGGTVVLTLPVGTGGLPIDTNTINLRGTIKGCGTINFTKTGTVLVYPILAPGLPRFSDPVVCANNGTATINLTNTIGGVKYVFSIGNTKLDSVTATSTAATLSIALSKLNPIANQITIRSLSVVGSISDCDKVTFTDSAKITINPDIDITFSTFSNDTVCSITDSATITISNSIVGVKYVFINGTTRLDSVTATAKNTIKKIAVSKFNLTAVTNVFTLSVEGSIQGVGCTPKTFADKPVVVINRLPSANPSVSATGPICQGGTSSVTINPTELGVTYTIYDNGKTVGTMVGKGESAFVDVVLNDLGKRKIDVITSIFRCGSVTLSDTGTVVVNKGSDIDLIVTATDTICVGNTANVKIEKAQLGVEYEVFELTTSVSTKITGTGKDTSFTISGLSVGSHTLRIQATTPGCGAAFLKATPVVQVNALPTDVNLVLIGDTVCNTATTATFTIRNTQAGVTYQAIFGTNPIGNAVRSNGGTVVLTLPVGTGGLPIDTNTINLRGTIKGCGTINFTKTGTVLVYPILVPGLPRFSDPVVCANVDSATVNLTNTIGGVKYVFSLGTTKIDSVTAKGNIASLKIALSKLNPVANQITIRSLSVVGSIDNCEKVAFTDSAKITINPDIDITFSTFSNDTVCSITDSATITISNSIVGVKYVFINGTTRLDSVTATAKNTIKKIAVSKFNLTAVTNVFTLSVEGSIQGVGCTPKTFADKPVVVINAEPDTNLVLVPGATVCVGSSSTVTIKNATVGVTYFLIDNGVVTANSQKGTGLDLTFTVLPKLGNNVYGFNATIAGCATYRLKNSVNIIANPGPDVNVEVTEVSPICFGDSTIITVSNTIATSFYQVLEKNVAVSDSVKGGGTIRFGVKNLAVGNHLLVVRASTKGCGYAYLTDTARVTVNPLPDSTLAVEGDTVCINVGTTNVTVSKTAINETYTLYEGAKQIGIPTLSKGGDLLISVPIGGTTGLAVGVHKLKVTSSIGGCKLITLKDSAIVVVNDQPDGDLKVVGDTVCSNSPNATVTIYGTKVGESYQAYINSVKVGNSQLSTGGEVVLILPVGKTTGLDTGSYIVQVKSFIPGCGTLDLTNNGNVRVNPLPDSTLAVDGDTVCGNSGNATVTVSKTAKGETYTLFEGKRIVGVPTLSAGGDLDILVPLSGTNGLTLGLHTLSVQSSIAGCAIITLKDSAKVLVNDQPSIDLAVIGDTVCSNSPNATVTILGTKVGESYQAFINNVAIGNKEISKGDTVVLTLPVGKPLGLDTGTYIVSVKSEIPGCGVLELARKATVRVNGLPSENLKVNGDTICETTAFAEVTINATTKGEIYQAFEGLKPVGSPVTSTGGLVTLQLPSATLGLGLHKITFTADIAGCAIVRLKDTANVLVNKLPDIDLEVQGDTVCSNSTEAIVTIFGTKPTEIYQAFLNGKAISKAEVSKGDTVKLTIPVFNLKVGGNKVNVVASIAGCTDVGLKDTADVLVNQLPDLALRMLGDTVCSNSSEGFVQIFDTKVGEIYTVYLGTTPLDTVTSLGGTTTLSVPVSKLKIGNNIITAQSTIAGCGVVDLDTNTIVRVNTLPSDTLEVIGDTVCESAISVEVKIKGTSIGESYQAFENKIALGSPVVSTGGDVILTIPVAGTLKAGLHKINVQSSINGCAIIDLKDTADVYLNVTPNLKLDVIGDTVCSNSDTATVAIKGTQAVEIYTALLNGKEVSAPVISQGGTVYLKIPVSKLKPDTNIVSIRSSIEGCLEQLLDKKAIVIVNGLPDSTLAVIGDTVCSSEIAAKVTIKNTTRSIIYTAYIGNSQIGQPVTSTTTGGDVVLTLPVVSLQPDTNRITIVASIDGCSDVTLNKKAIVILNKLPEVDLTLTGSVVCSTADFATLTISPSDKNAVYQVLLAGVPIGNPVIGTGAAITANLPVSKLKIDTNIVSVAINISGCNESLVNKTAKVVVNKLPSDSLLTDGGVVCSDMENASVRVYGTQRNVVYQAYDPIKPIGAAVTSRGGEITLVLPVADLQKGANKIVVRASVDACATVTLKDTADVFINTLPDPNISVTGSSVCPGQDGTVTIAPTQLNVVYSVLVNGVTTSSTAIGNGGEKSIVVPFSLLTKRNNEITISADIQACRTITLARRGFIGSIMKDGPGISGDSILCFGDTASYSVEPIENAVAYNWTIRSKNGLAKFITDNSKRKVTVQADTFNFRLRMTPVSTFGTCETVAFEDSITVEDTVKGVGSIWGRDTVCVNDIDTLHIEGIRNATSYLWHYPKSDQVDVMKVFYTDTVYAEKLVNNVLVKDTIYTTTTYSRHKVQYLESGLQTFYVKPFMRCKNINGAYADSVVKVVKVLENAVAEAGEYVDPQFTAEANFIQLNGAGSSTDSRKDTLNKYSYKWYTDAKTPGQILNQTTLYDATLKPEVEETKVYLLVTNRNGLCPAKDSTTIKVQFDIDIPNVFSPNGDGNHDFFEIKNLNKLYPDAVLTIFNKWGSVVYVSGAGYPEPWDGKRNGEDMPVATYYYILDTKGGRTYSPGSVTIIR